MRDARLAVLAEAGGDVLLQAASPLELTARLAAWLGASVDEGLTGQHQPDGRRDYCHRLERFDRAGATLKGYGDVTMDKCVIASR